VTDEIWKSVAGFEGVAEVSSLGRVRTLDRRVQLPPTLRRDGKPTTRIQFGRVLTPERSRNGYLRVKLQVGGRGSRVNLFVHRAVCEAFHGPRPSSASVCRHLNDQQDDNRAENLAWGSVAENRADAVRNGRVARGRGVNTAKLTEDDVVNIRRRVAAGEPCASVMRDFDVAHSTLWHAAHGKTWSHLDGAVPLARGAAT
jgi:hypothetical protein